MRDVVAGSRRVVMELEPEVAGLLQACEKEIEQALDSAHHALRRIHDDKLYKADGYKTFEDYAEKRWGYSKSRAYQLIDHSKIVEHLKNEGVEILPGGEGMTRPLQKLRRISKSEDDFMQRVEEAWQIAQDTAPKVHDVPQVTVNHVESTMEHYGLYRSVKRKNPDEDAVELRELLTKIGQSDAMKLAPEAFLKRYELKGFPSNFPRIVTWLSACADLADVRD